MQRVEIIEDLKKNQKDEIIRIQKESLNISIQSEEYSFLLGL